MIAAALPLVAALALGQPIQPSDPATVSRGEYEVAGSATWYAAASLHHAAASRRLRRWLGRGWRNDIVRVTHHGRTIRVRLTDWCGCPHGRLIDLSDEGFKRLAPLSTGVIHVKISKPR